VSGYPDGQFKPGRSVNYAEALKILGELYDYVAYSADDEEWYAGYVRAAQFNKTALPSSIKYDRALTRGQMARLAAAYRAHYEGELETYRLSEKSLNLVIAQEIAEKVDKENEKQEEEKVAEEVEEVVEEEESVYTFPATNRFLVLGTRQLIASGMFQPRSESVVIANATVKFREEVKNIRSLYLVDEQGNHIAEFKPDIFDKYELTWKAQGEAVESYAIPIGGKALGLEALVQGPGDGFSQEPIQVKWISMNVYPIGAMENGYQIIATNTSYPIHQSAMGKITSVRNNKPPVVDLGEGEGVMIAEFEISGEHVDGGEVRLNHLTFTVAERTGVILTNYILGAIHSTHTVPCSLGDRIYINCSNIPASVGWIERGSVIVQLWADIYVDDTVAEPILKIDFDKPGVISTFSIPGEMGHLRWTDGSGAFNWVELSSPISEGSVWK
ncbi:MAG: hypothetical protein QF815_03615, partial [Candidatus Peribacteraceae bacterium]|nr:hypothetical protein [Candidatus Peribacteraceae bacterium]